MKKDSTVSEQVNEPGFWRELWQQARLVFYLLLDPEVPIYLKVLPFMALVYLLVPFDLLPDFAPGLGQVDDITLLLIGAKVFVELAPPQAVARQMQRIRERDGYDYVAEPTEKTPDPDVIEGIVIDERDLAAADKKKEDRT